MFARSGFLFWFANACNSHWLIEVFYNIFQVKSFNNKVIFIFVRMFTVCINSFSFCIILFVLNIDLFSFAALHPWSVQMKYKNCSINSYIVIYFMKKHKAFYALLKEKSSLKNNNNFYVFSFKNVLW